MGCKAPQNYGWTERALKKGYQVLFLDQRGTGLSSTVTAQTLANQGGLEEQAEYLRHFRADSIGKGSRPEGLQEAYICAGLAPLVNQPDPVYKNLYTKVAERSRAYYKKYTEDIQRVKNIVHYLQTEDVELPSGGTLSITRFRQLGIHFGFHDIILRMASDLDNFGYFTRPTLSQFEGLLPFDTLPLYALVHELIYLQGDNASNWSADRVMKEHPEFMNLSTSNDEPIYFTGEMIYPSMFTSYSELRPLAATASILSQMSHWPTLYDETQLANNTVPVYASAYMDDMYVSFDLAMATAKKIKGCKYFVTNTMYHDAISHAGRSEELFRQLFQLRDDCLD
ncbi:MAG: hypothetical protein LQ343_003369 [Gyalolechia ehrenbergii]|nr:MAG: hypothetical protein LQ343_003369 [Gyalolechia ehrenbergii]